MVNLVNHVTQLGRRSVVQRTWKKPQLDSHTKHSKRKLSSTPALNLQLKNDEYAATSSAASSTSDTVWTVNFDDAEFAYKSKSNSELIRGLVVLKLCSANIVVDNALKIAEITERVCGQRIYKKLMKSTFFGHFAAGECPQEIKEVTDNLSKYGVGAILAYSVEEDVNADVSLQLQHETHEKNTQFNIDCIETAAHNGGVAAIKLTSLSRPTFLLSFSEIIRKRREIFRKLCGAENWDIPLVDLKLEVSALQKNLSVIDESLNPNDISTLFKDLDVDGDGIVDVIDWQDYAANLEKYEISPLENVIPQLTLEEKEEYQSLMEKVERITKTAYDNDVTMFIDAEQTYFNPAISEATMLMMKKYNQDKVIVVNTYQSYLKETRDNLEIELEISRRHRFLFGVKLVRGAYMEQERERASQHNYEDPVHPNYATTNTNYNSNLCFLLNEIQRRGGIKLIVATHNQETLELALQKLKEYNISPNTNTVYFGQLMGMCDFLTFPLGQAGQNVLKYLPYGPINEVLPYLHRRSQENRSILESTGSNIEKKMIWNELKRRVGLST